MRGPLAASALATVCIVLIGAAWFGPARERQIGIYAQTKLPAPRELPVAPEAIAWGLPPGWQTEAPSGFAFAAVAPPSAEAGTICSFTLVSAGPEMMTRNITRWAGQLGLQGSDAISDHQELAHELAPVQVMRMANPERPQRAFLLGAMSFSDRLLTVKLSAPLARLDELEPAFIALLGSLRAQDG